MKDEEIVKKQFYFFKDKSTYLGKPYRNGHPNKFRRNISEIIPDKTIPNAFTWMTF